MGAAGRVPRALPFVSKTTKKPARTPPRPPAPAVLPNSGLVEPVGGPDFGGIVDGGSLGFFEVFAAFTAVGVTTAVGVAISVGRGVGKGVGVMSVMTRTGVCVAGIAAGV